MGRGQAVHSLSGEEIRDRLAAQGVTVLAEKMSVIAEEAPEVYKPSEEIVDVVDQVGIAGKVARLIPMGVIKG